MSDLKVDFMLLEMAEKDLGTLKHEFDNLEKRRDETEDLWGHRGVRDAMGEFAGNMDRSRKKLSESLQVLGEQISATLQAFRAAEDELVTAWEKE